MRTTIAAALAGCGLVAIARAFWVLDLRYALPTPVPAGHVDVAPGRVVALPAELERRVRAAAGPTLLHVFNPDCPCSRFNLEHVVSIARAFDRRAQVVAILEGDDPERSRRLFAELGVDLVACADPDGRIAAGVGAYSTPQAAILDRSLRLVWRGNYNVTRYCRDQATEFARIALEHAVAGRPIPPFVEGATRAFGCPLPDGPETSP